MSISMSRLLEVVGKLPQMLLINTPNRETKEQFSSKRGVLEPSGSSSGPPPPFFYTSIEIERYWDWYVVINRIKADRNVA